MSKLETIRHSLAHIMASAVQELYPGVKFGIGPAIENGFYYDFDFVDYYPPKAGSRLRRAPADQRGLQRGLTRITPGDLPRIEKRMRELIKKDTVFKKKVISKKGAKKIFKDQPYKLELIREMPGKRVSIYKSGNFVDLCLGPHVKSTKEISFDSFKLTKVAGAYWKGSEKNPMLTRIYGVVFKNKKELEDYFRITEEAERRDHRALGKILDLFSFDEEVGAGLPMFHPKGIILRKTIEDFLTKELLKFGYQFVNTPHIGKESLFQTSGHLDFYKENMYSPFEIEKEKYYLRPMNCPFHIKIYKSKIRSYKDLPLRLAELGTVYRYEKSGVLHGLTRVRGFTIDDAHIWVSQDQLSNELVKILKEGLNILKAFGFTDYDVYLSTRPEKYVGNLKLWQKAENSLKFASNSLRVKYQIDPGGGVFYGPKVDIKIKDSLGRPWQCTTVQVDFNLPEKFNLNFIGKSGKKQIPIMIHRALLGSIERFIGVLLENYAGALPFWLSPIQIWVIPVGSRHRKYAHQVGKEFQISKLRFQIKNTAETVSKKIREGELQKIPYLLVVGDKEMKRNSVRVRERGKGDIGIMKLNKFLEKVKK